MSEGDNMASLTLSRSQKGGNNVFVPYDDDESVSPSPTMPPEEEEEEQPRVETRAPLEDLDEKTRTEVPNEVKAVVSNRPTEAPSTPMLQSTPGNSQSSLISHMRPVTTAAVALAAFVLGFAIIYVLPRRRRRGGEPQDRKKSVKGFKHLKNEKQAFNPKIPINFTMETESQESTSQCCLTEVSAEDHHLPYPRYHPHSAPLSSCFLKEGCSSEDGDDNADDDEMLFFDPVDLEAQQNNPHHQHHVLTEDHLLFLEQPQQQPKHNLDVILSSHALLKLTHSHSYDDDDDSSTTCPEQLSRQTLDLFRLKPSPPPPPLPKTSAGCLDETTHDSLSQQPPAATNTIEEIHSDEHLQLDLQSGQIQIQKTTPQHQQHTPQPDPNDDDDDEPFILLQQHTHTFPRPVESLIYSSDDTDNDNDTTSTSSPFRSYKTPPTDDNRSTASSHTSSSSLSSNSSSFTQDKSSLFTPTSSSSKSSWSTDYYTTSSLPPTSGTGTSTNKTPPDHQSHLNLLEIKAEILLLIRTVVPEEIPNIEDLLKEYKQKEEELLEVLRLKQERQIALKARKARVKTVKREALKLREMSGGIVGLKRLAKMEMEDGAAAGNDDK